MFSTLPDLVDPWRAAESNTVFAGRLPLSGLLRLSGLLLSDRGSATYRLGFRRDHDRRAIVVGEVDACLTLRCERCLRALKHPVKRRVELALVEGIDEANLLPERYEPLLVSDRGICPQDVIEDELMLGLPQIPMHEPGACRLAMRNPTDPPPDRRENEVNPFAVLASLKREGKT